jgi:hypothetical protein
VPNGFDQLAADDSSSVYLESANFEGGCTLTRVEPQPLRLGVRIPGCDPGPPGERFAVKYVRIGSYQAWASCKPETAADRLVTFDPSTRKEVVGPIIMRVSGACSHDYPVWVYAAGSLWVYNSNAGPNGRSGAVAELSTSTGKLETLVTVPDMPAAVIAADKDGFYVGPGEFYGPGQGIYHVAPGSSHAQLVRRVPGPMAWLFGFGHSMYAALQYDYVQPCLDHDCQLWRFEGTNATPKLINSEINPGVSGITPVGNGSVGILIVKSEPSRYPTSFDVVRIAPSTGGTELLAHVPTAKNAFIESTAYVRGSFYALVDEVPSVGPTRLIRVSR